MPKNSFIDMNRNSLNIDLVLSFICPETKKCYAVINNGNKIFDKSSKYENLDVLEIASHVGNNIMLKPVEPSEWGTVKDFFYQNICGNIKSNVVY
jgi:hypothetical protein